MVINPVC